MKNRIQTVQNNIKDACEKVGRIESEVTLIAVSKTKPLEMLQEAYALGMRDFGENKVQEMVSKVEQLPKDIRWHMIGHLQKNKVKYLAESVYMIHSLDSVDLAKEIQKQAEKVNRIIPVLIEVNIAGEESKFGVSPENVEALAREVSKLPNVKVKGLMTVPPIQVEESDNRKYFSALRQLSVDIKQKNIDNIDMDVLSMGMTDDYPSAVEEGASYVRVGTGIFGHRIYKTEGER